MFLLSGEQLRETRAKCVPASAFLLRDYRELRVLKDVLGDWRTMNLTLRFLKFTWSMAVNFAGPCANRNRA